MWTSDISSIVFTRVKVQFSSTIKAKYPDLYFTNSDKTQTTSKFPTVYVHEVGSSEQGQDLDNTGINAVLSTFQIDVTDSQSQARHKYLWLQSSVYLKWAMRKWSEQ